MTTKQTASTWPERKKDRLEFVAMIQSTVMDLTHQYELIGMYDKAADLVAAREQEIIRATLEAVKKICEPGIDYPYDYIQGNVCAVIIRLTQAIDPATILNNMGDKK